VSNLKEVIARQGKVILLGDTNVIERFKDKISFDLCLPTLDPFILPILYKLPLLGLLYSCFHGN